MGSKKFSGPNPYFTPIHQLERSKSVQRESPIYNKKTSLEKPIQIAPDFAMRKPKKEKTSVKSFSLCDRHVEILGKLRESFSLRSDSETLRIVLEAFEQEFDENQKTAA